MRRLKESRNAWPASADLWIRGPKHLVRSLPEWLGLGSFAYPDPGAELAARQA